MTSVSIPESVGCESLTSINIPDSVTEIGKYAFHYCLNLESINIPESVKKIGECSFESCESLTSINIPDGITKIEKCTFLDCENLESISIPKSVKEIGECAFHACYSLKDIYIPESVEKIGKSAFDYTKWIKEKKNENPLVIVNNILISGKMCEGDVVIPDNVISICGNAFENSNIESIAIPQGITTIGCCTFDSCFNLTEITIPDSVTKIENNAFYDCKSLKTVHYTEPLTKYQLGSTEGNNYFIEALFGNIEEELKNSYEIIPLLEPFNEYFFVKTANISPQSFRFVDKDSVYSDNSTIVYCDDIFSDVKYTKIYCKILAKVI